MNAATTTTTATPEKAIIVAMLDRWIRQRPGMEYANYGDAASYRSELRGITKDGSIAKRLLRYVELADSITAQDIISASARAFSGRLVIAPSVNGWKIDYCTGQYWPTEYRRAVCAVLSSAIWNYWRDNMPAPNAFVVKCIAEGGGYVEATSKRFPTAADAEAYAATVAASRSPMVWDLYDGKTAGEYLRAKAVREFGRGIAARFFD
jgi:hypothetical protein